MSSIALFASNLFEHATCIIIIEKYLWTNDNQFTFKSGHSQMFAFILYQN